MQWLSSRIEPSYKRRHRQVKFDRHQVQIRSQSFPDKLSTFSGNSRLKKILRENRDRSPERSSSRFMFSPASPRRSHERGFTAAADRMESSQASLKPMCDMLE